MGNSKNNKIIIKAAKVHNLTNISLEILRDKLVGITVIFGSGKSQQAFDILVSII